MAATRLCFAARIDDNPCSCPLGPDRAAAVQYTQRNALLAVPFLGSMTNQRDGRYAYEIAGQAIGKDACLL
jgi:hypothetical protein